jgi:hypothetical protein
VAHSFQNLDGTTVLTDADGGVAELCCDWHLVLDWRTESEHYNNHITNESRLFPPLRLNRFQGHAP